MLRLLGKRLFNDKALWTNLLCVLFVFGVLSPILATGFYWDDSVLAGTAGMVEDSGLSLHQYLINSSLIWINESGRLFPVGLTIVKLANFFFGAADPFIPKLLHVALIAATLVVVGKLLTHFTKSRAVGVLFMLIGPLCFQVRPWHDPMTSFLLLLPFVSLMMFGQALLLELFLENGRWYRLVLSVILFTVALLTYEIAVILPLLNAVILIRYGLPLSRAAKLTLPYAVVFAGYLCAVAIIRNGQVYPGVAIAPFEGFGRSMVVNLVGAIPFSYWFFDPRGVFNLGLFCASDLIVIGGIGAGLAALVLLIWKTIAFQIEAVSLKTAAVFGAVAWSSTSALMASSSRYRSDVSDFGTAHTASFIGAIGVGILITCGYSILIEMLAQTSNKKRNIHGLGVTIAIVPLLVLTTDNTVLRWQEALFDTAKQAAFNRAAKLGMLSDVPNDAIICDSSGTLYYWLTPFYIRMFIHRVVIINAAQCSTHTTPIFVLDFKKQENTDWLRRPQYSVSLRRQDAIYAPPSGK